MPAKLVLARGNHLRCKDERFGRVALLALETVTKSLSVTVAGTPPDDWRCLDVFATCQTLSLCIQNLYRNHPSSSPRRFKAAPLCSKKPVASPLCFARRSSHGNHSVPLYSRTSPRHHPNCPWTDNCLSDVGSTPVHHWRKATHRPPPRRIVHPPRLASIVTAFCAKGIQMKANVEHLLGRKAVAH